MNNRETVGRFTRYWQSGLQEREAPTSARHTPPSRTLRPGCRPATAHFLPRGRRQRVYASFTPSASGGNNKGPGSPEAFDSWSVAFAYFSEVLIEENWVFSLVPRPLTTAMIASEMPAAIRPYSIAVAPDSSFTKRAMRFFIVAPCVHVAGRTNVWSRRRSQHRDHGVNLRSENCSAVNSIAQ